MVQKIMARKVNFSLLYASNICTPGCHNFFKSSINGARYTSMSFPGCLGPDMSKVSMMYLRFIHNQGEDYKCTIEPANCYACCSCYCADLFQLQSSQALDFYG